MVSLNVPILFLVFNRPAETSKVFEVIRQAQPANLYIAADGPRSGQAGEEKLVAKVRSISEEIDWDCDVRTLFRDQNLGCKMAVSGAISWFFENEDEGIILEDDCLPNTSFFPYCQELLERYRHDSRIMCISGDNFQQGRERSKYSYFFSRYTHIWGWASWRRAWKQYDRDLLAWPKIRETGFLNDISDGNEAFVAYWFKIFDACYAGQIDTWDYPLVFSCWQRSGLTILPNVNLVTNIGFGKQATHTTETNASLRIPSKEILFPLKHPLSVRRNTAADQFTEEQYFSRGKKKPFFQKIGLGQYFKIMSRKK